jgi:hypothetical protein
MSSTANRGWKTPPHPFYVDKVPEHKKSILAMLRGDDTARHYRSEAGWSGDGVRARYHPRLGTVGELMNTSDARPIRWRISPPEKPKD